MKILELLLLLPLLGAFLSSCQTFSGKDESQQPLILPFIKNSPKECYYLDEFMPTPNSLVSGKHGALNLRYYTYNSAQYKDWSERQVILSFYSGDAHCWTLFEEYYVNE